MFVFVDIETTGLSPFHDQILELGIAIVDRNLEIVDEESWVACSRHPGDIRSTVTQAVREMHDESGLWDALLDYWNKPGYRKPWSDIQTEALALLEKHGVKGSPMAGSSVSFDRQFIDEHLPGLGRVFHYRNIDVSSFREAARELRPDLVISEPEGQHKHRALPDIHDSINLLLFYAGEFGMIAT